MTQENRTKVLEEALSRAYAEIAETPGKGMREESFERLLRGAAVMESLLGAPPDRDDFPEESADQKTEDGEPDTSEPAEPATAEHNENEKPKYKMEEVRAALAKARAKGINVAAIIRSFGVDNFQQIDKGKYPEIMAKLAEEGAV